MDADERESAARRLEILDALTMAAANRDEVSAAVWESADPTDAERRVQELLGVGPEASRAVLEVQLRRWTASERAKLAVDRAELRAVLAT